MDKIDMFFMGFILGGIVVGVVSTIILYIVRNN